MITEIQVHEILSREFPELKRSFLKNNKDIFTLMRRFTSYTQNCALKGNTERLRKCFRIAENFLKNGNKAVRSAVENCYVYSVSSLLEVYSPVQGLIRKILPMTLKKDCLKHMADINSLNDLKDESCFFQEEILNYKGELMEFEHNKPIEKTKHENDILPNQYFTIQHPSVIASTKN
jgi:hypothetical protein